jgi:hypothetical protein
MLVLRTNRRFWRSKPGGAPLTTSIAVAAITLALLYSPLAGVLKLNLTRPAPAVAGPQQARRSHCASGTDATLGIVPVWALRVGVRVPVGRRHPAAADRAAAGPARYAQCCRT